MKNKLNYFVIAESVIRDADQKKVSILNLYNRMAVSELPVIRPKLAVAFGFYPSEVAIKKGIIDIKIEVLNPKDEIIAEINGKSRRNKPMDDKRVRELTSYVDLSNDLIIDRGGIYTFRLYCNDELLAESELDVEVVKGAKK